MTGIMIANYQIKIQNLVHEISFEIGENGLGLELDDGLLFGREEALLVCGVTSVGDQRIRVYFASRCAANFNGLLRFRNDLITAVGEHSLRGKPFHDAIEILKQNLVPHSEITLQIMSLDEQEDEIRSHSSSSDKDSEPDSPNYPSNEVTDQDTDPEEAQTISSIT